MVRRSFSRQAYALAKSPSPTVNTRNDSPAPFLYQHGLILSSSPRVIRYPRVLVDARLSTSKPTENEVPQIILKLSSILEDVHQYRKILECTGDNAQNLLDVFQSLLFSPGLESGFRRRLVVAVQKLSRKSNLYPTCFTLDGVQLIGDEPVAAGSFGDVYKGQLHARHVCLKVIRMYQTSKSEHIFKYFSREAVLWGQLSHPNLLPFFGLFRFRSRMCLVSPWMDNGAIIYYLENNPNVDRLLLASDIATGVSYLHENNVIHGDLKGANILVTNTGRACLADFGLSAITDPEIMIWTSQSSGVSKGGSIRWQAPELLNIDDDFVPNSKESDVYALACVYYEIFTGNVPFVEVPRDTSVMLKVRAGTRPTRPVSSSPAWTTRGLTEVIWDLIQECWRENLASRPNVEEVLSRLARVTPIDKRPTESVDLIPSASFRNSLGSALDVYNLADLETLIYASHEKPD
ncbi:kinase-like domain-containing protein [Collybia nuda]|uniref:Kinase-like domain-containing protein n=1 Tax=Collybia nuda TaxID=64659 RepID=A0A9P5XYN0_9AGAR|nr:kinase-like domain-containing protein [Collybia nuda]